MSSPEPGEKPAAPGAPAWSAVKAVLGEALDLRDSERAAYLEKACAGDAALRARVEEMLAAYSGDDHTLNPDAGRIAMALKEELTTGALDAVGKKIGRYTVERLIGRGGMGAVYEARDQTLGRQVALKVVGAAFAAPDVLRRFAHESKVLARLQHPGIAQVYESGIHHEPGFDRPTPYFAMELVDGATPINVYCRDGAVGLPRTLELLASVCDAVHHGHQRGVIHRDLKPGNILVDARGAAKVIDFGVARVMDSDVAATARTREGQIVGTLNYMSPEQCRADSDAIDIRADVYSLGVVLYECLTGSTPYEAGGQSGNTPAGSNLVAMLRAIEHDAPVRPSRRVHALRGDIETVVLKALEKSPERRYQSAAELGAELRRVLAHQPIAAHPPSAAYELAMFVRRNRSLVAATALVFLALVGGVIGTTAGLARAKQAQARAQLEAQRATRIASFFKKAFRSADPALLPPSVYATLSPDLYAMELATSPDGQWGRAQQAGEQTTVKDVLRFAAEHLEQEFADDPVLESELRLSVGEILNSLNDIVGGVPQALRGLEGLASELSDDDPRVIRARWLLGSGFLTNPSPDRALPLLEKALDAARRVYGPLAPFTVLIRRDIALAYAFLKGRGEEALHAQRALIQEVAAASGADSAAAWAERAALTNLLRITGKTEEAAANGREAVAGLDRLAGRDAGPTIRARRDLYASLALNPAYVDEAFDVISASLDSAERFYGSDHPVTADIRGYKLLHALRRRDLESAEALARRSLDFGRRVYGPESDSIGRAEGTLARILIWRGTNAAEALSLAEHSIVIAREKLKVPPEEDFLCYYGAIRAGALRLLGRTDEAMTELNARMADRRDVQSRGGVAWVEIMLYAELSASQLALGKTEPAREWLDKAEAMAKSMRDQTFPSVLYVRDIRAAFDKATGREATSPAP